MGRNVNSPTVVIRSFASKLLKGKYLEQLRYTLHGRRILGLQAGHDSIADSLRTATPAAAGKIGDVEMEGIVKIRFQPGGETDDTRWRGDKERLYVNAGIFPPTPEAFRAFAVPYLAGLREITHMGVWFNKGEERITRECCPSAKLMGIRATEPYYFPNPWSSLLAGKRVLIATCFPKTIARQYERRASIWRDGRNVLPEFQPQFIPVPPHAHLLKEPVYPDWQTGLKVMQDKISAATFDVLLVGAGGWSIPLAAHAKRLGKIGIHMGGGLQVLFGIKGHRWQGHELSGYWNDAWVHPLAEETPENTGSMERGAYW